ncbi:MAG: SOS response-associated peptidase [Lachnospiraceae bacterium]|nr:SOS response-associated peptidase [Lachnospiraceae bacterium]
MCCRYWADDSLEYREIVEEMNRSPLVGRWQKKSAVRSGGEIRPTDVVPVIAPDRRGRRAVFPMKWGFMGKSLLINARSETASVKPMFREAWRRHRCIVPSSWYFEWEHQTGSDGKVRTADKYILQQGDSVMTWMCGLYRIEEGLPVFVILTGEAGEEIRFIHDRMPLVLPRQYTDEWISPDADPERLLKQRLTGMVFEKAL